MLSAIDEDRIEAAVAKAEEGTSGEIVCVLAGEVATYSEIPLAWAAGVALALPAIALALGLIHPLSLTVGNAWMLAQAGALENDLGLALGAYATVQVLLFIVTALVVAIPAVRRRLTPRLLKRHRVAKAAHQQFAAIAARAQASETGVLIFVALDDRQVQVLADAGIHQKVGEAAWTRAAGAIAAAMKGGHDPTAGIVEAVEICGAALKEHFPASGPHPHAFSARPLEI
ncbi:MAG: TPM domain-containing protein [Caulobacteraceae bacterium]